MTIRIAINGFGRIGCNILRAAFEHNRHGSDVEFVAINDLATPDILAYSTKYDSTFGPFPGEVSADEKNLIINGHKIPVFSERDPANLPWAELNVDVVYECTGLFRKRDQAMAHIKAGAKKVLISAPGADADATIVYGVNHKTLKASDVIVSNASCTTNCLAPMAKVLGDTVGIKSGLMNTIHSFTNDQRLLDGMHADIRRSRCATLSIIPTKTGAAAAVGLVLPELNGKLDGFALRVPTIDVSIVDLTFESERETSVEEVNAALKAASEGELKGILCYCDEPLVSIDFKHDPASSTIDAGLTRVSGNQVKVCSWYDNEWGFSNRMVDTSLAMMAAS
jgi:glyceraldehyde 3-phosphate dehydrogenase